MSSEVSSHNVTSPLNKEEEETLDVDADEDVESFTDIIGENGSFQKYILFLYVAIYIISPTQNYGITFYAETPDYRCESDGLTTFDANITKGACHSSSDLSEKCEKFEYDHSFYRSTIVTEFDLVCDKSIYISYSKSIYQIGYLVSSVLFGWISDKHGRQLAFRLSVILEILSGLSQALSVNVDHFMISRFFLGIAAYSRFLTGMIIIVEWAGSKNRARVRILTEFGWSIGSFLCPIAFYFIRDFRYMQLLVVAYEILLSYPLLKYIPESPQWLLVQGKMDELKELLIRAAVKNKKGTEEEVTKKLDILYRKYQEEEKDKMNEKDVNILDFWKIPVLLKYSLAQYFIWFSNAFAGYGVSYNAGDFGSSIFLNFLGFALIDTVSSIFIYFIIDKFKRKTLYFTFFIIAAIYCYAIVPISFDTNQYVTLRFIILMIGRIAPNGIYHMVYLLSAEIYPTSIRHVGVGSNSVAARIGSSIAPFVKELTEATNLAVTFALFGTLYMCSGFMGILLPETKDKPIPDTLQQAATGRRKSIAMVDKADRRVSIISHE